MSILSRFTQIIASNVNALLDKAEDPVKMCDQYIAESQKDLEEVPDYVQKAFQIIFAEDISDVLKTALVHESE